ncbi:MAG: hypothetical protein D6729_08175 [Deltaproteobacteria bacterium]|nr:MAG: hypothetical protein D6729_08175 [Deltaproteobacteria bacterium]
MEAALRLAGFTGLSESELAQRLGLAPRQVTRAAEALLAAGRARLAAKAPRTLLHAESALRLEARLLARVEVAQRGGAVLGVPAESVRQGLPGPPPRRLFERLVARLVAAGRLRREGDLLASPAIPTALQGAEAEWAKGARAALAQAGLRPPRTAELARALGCPPQRLEDLLCRLEAEGHLVRVQGDLFFDRGAIDALRGRLLAHLEAHGRISTQEFKAMTGATRKHAIPLAEYFDQTRVTLRVGDARIARKGRR